MANTFKNKVLASIGTTAQGYVTPAATTTTVIGMVISNRTTANIKVSATVTDTSAASLVAYLVKDAIVPVGGNIVVVGGDQKVVLETGDKLFVSSDTGASADLVISMMETT